MIELEVDGLCAYKHMKGMERSDLQCESKNTPPYGFLKFFPKRLRIFNQFLHAYYTIISTLDYKLLFKYLQLWQSYAILSATT